MRRSLVVAAALLVTATALQGEPPGLRPEIRPFGGVNIATGDQREFFKDAPVFGVQTAVQIMPFLHVLGTFGWAPVQNKYAVANADANILQYDAGVELGFVQALGNDWQMKPFVGIGGGARTYLYQDTGLNDKTCTAGYAAAGTEFQLNKVALRLEARDNLYCYRSPIPGIESKTRNDVGLALGIAYHIR